MQEVLEKGKSFVVYFSLTRHTSPSEVLPHIYVTQVLCLQAVIFVDNSGADVILGILPFARELLRRGTQVYFAVTFFLMHDQSCWLFWESF